MRKTRLFKQDGKLVVHSASDPTAALASVKLAREAPQSPLSDSWHVGRIDAHVLTKWIKEAGLRYDDREAVKELIARKLMDGDNAAFRVKGGSF